MTHTLEQIKEAAAKPLAADVAELAPVREALATMDVAKAVDACIGLKLRVSPAEAVAVELAKQQTRYSYLDCLDIVGAVIYEAFGE